MTHNGKTRIAADIVGNWGLLQGKFPQKLGQFPRLQRHASQLQIYLPTLKPQVLNNITR